MQPLYLNNRTILDKIYDEYGHLSRLQRWSVSFVAERFINSLMAYQEASDQTRLTSAADVFQNYFDIPYLIKCCQPFLASFQTYINETMQHYLLSLQTNFPYMENKNLALCAAVLSFRGGFEIKMALATFYAHKLLLSHHCKTILMSASPLYAASALVELKNAKILDDGAVSLQASIGKHALISFLLEELNCENNSIRPHLNWLKNKDLDTVFTIFTILHQVQFSRNNKNRQLYILSLIHEEPLWIEKTLTLLYDKHLLEDELGIVNCLKILEHSFPKDLYQALEPLINNEEMYFQKKEILNNVLKRNFGSMVIQRQQNINQNSTGNHKTIWAVYQQIVEKYSSQLSLFDNVYLMSLIKELTMAISLCPNTTSLEQEAALRCMKRMMEFKASKRLLLVLVSLAIKDEPLFYSKALAQLIKILHDVQWNNDFSFASVLRKIVLGLQGLGTFYDIRHVYLQHMEKVVRSKIEKPSSAAWNKIKDDVLRLIIQDCGPYIAPQFIFKRLDDFYSKIESTSLSVSLVELEVGECKESPCPLIFNTI